MSHRAQQILESIASAISGVVPTSIGVHVHRRYSLSNDHDELPAITVDFGEDVPPGAGSAFLDGGIESVLTVNVTGVAIADDEDDLRSLLLDLRTHVHVGIKRVPDLELPFVQATVYGGALRPDVDVSGEKPIGELTSQWGVMYEMNPQNPE